MREIKIFWAASRNFLVAGNIKMSGSFDALAALSAAPLSQNCYPQGPSANPPLFFTAAPSKNQGYVARFLMCGSGSVSRQAGQSAGVEGYLPNSTYVIPTPTAPPADFAWQEIINVFLPEVQRHVVSWHLSVDCMARLIHHDPARNKTNNSPMLTAFLHARGMHPDRELPPLTTSEIQGFISTNALNQRVFKPRYFKKLARRQAIFSIDTSASMDHPVKKGGDFVQSRGEAAPLCETRRQEQRATSGASLIVSRLMCQHKLPVYTSGPGFVANASLLTAETFALYDRVDGRTPLLGVIDQIKINVIADSFTSFIRLPNIIMFISTDGEPTDTSIDRFCMQLVDLVKKGIKVSSADNKKYTRKVCVVIQYIGDDPIVLEKYNKIDGMFSRIDVNDDDASEWEEINRNERFIRKYGHFSTQDIRMKIVMGAAVKQIGNADGNNRQEGCVPSV